MMGPDRTVANVTATAAANGRRSLTSCPRSSAPAVRWRQLHLARDVLSTIVDGAPLSFEAQMTLTAMALLAVSQAIRDAEALQPPDAVEDGTAVD